MATSSNFQEPLISKAVDLENRDGSSAALSEVSSTSRSHPRPRIRLALVSVLHILDAAVTFSLAIGAYGGDWTKVWNLDFEHCLIHQSIVEFPFLALARACFFFVILLVPSRHIVSALPVTICVCPLCSSWAMVKLFFVATSAECTLDATGQLRQREMVFTLLVVSILFPLAEMAFAIWVRTNIRREQALEHVMFHVSTYASSYTSIHGMYGPSKRAGSDPQQPSNTAQLFKLASKQSFWLSAGCIALFIRLPFSLSLPHFVSEIIGDLLEKDHNAVTNNILCFVVAGCIDAFLDFWCVFLFGYTQQRIIRALRIDLFRSILNQEIAFFDNTSTGEISSRLSSDCAEMANDLTWVFRFTIEALVRIFGIAGYMFYRNWKLASVACTIIPIVAVVNRFYGHWMQKNATRVQEAMAASNAVAHEVISNMRTVYSFANEVQEAMRYEACVDRHYRLNVRQTIISGLYYMGVCTFLISCCVQASILTYGSHLVFAEELTPQTLLAFMLYQGQLQEYFSNLLNSFTNLLKSAGAGSKVFELLNRRPRIRRTGSIKLARVEGHVAFEAVRFQYPTRDKVALEDVTFHVAPGEQVAIVGPSGAGKSTIFHLLQVEQAARASNAHEFITGLPQGYQTGVGERGVQLSGGQKQRVAIARALIQEPAVLLLDEATSALDTASEMQVQQALDRAMQGRTVIIIAHRLSTVQRVNRLVVLDKGRVLQLGTHDALLALPRPADGAVSYRGLVEQQSLAAQAFA